ncbi:hypothetical protein CHUAL_011632 [Chamberlinius hualienensis]
MSFLGKAFGKKTKSKSQVKEAKVTPTKATTAAAPKKVRSKQQPTAGDAIQKLREMEDMLLKKQEYLEGKITQELKTARQNASKDKRVAIQALKRKKKYESQLQQIDGTLSTLEFQREALENAHMNTGVLNVMGQASTTLKKIHTMSVDDVEDLMDEISEQQQIATEISEAISRPMALQDDVDLDDLEKELEELEQEDLNDQLLTLDIEKQLPSPPATKIRAGKTKVEDDEEMKGLEEWATAT